jgi:hypothetical protein
MGPYSPPQTVGRLPGCNILTFAPRHPDIQLSNNCKCLLQLNPDSGRSQQPIRTTHFRRIWRTGYIFRPLNARALKQCARAPLSTMSHQQMADRRSTPPRSAAGYRCDKTSEGLVPVRRRNRSPAHQWRAGDPILPRRNRLFRRLTVTFRYHWSIYPWQCDLPHSYCG